MESKANSMIKTDLVPVNTEIDSEYYSREEMLLKVGNLIEEKLTAIGNEEHILKDFYKTIQVIQTDYLVGGLDQGMAYRVVNKNKVKNGFIRLLSVTSHLQC